MKLYKYFVVVDNQKVEQWFSVTIALNGIMKDASKFLRTLNKLTGAVFHVHHKLLRTLNKLTGAVLHVHHHHNIPVSYGFKIVLLLCIIPSIANGH